MNSLFYTGVGSRKTPEDILELMNEIARFLSKRNFILRSGGAKGADKAFEKGAIDKEIFYAKDSTQAGEDLAAKFHPAWHNCKEYARKLHGRNSFQVLGRDLNTPSKFLMCWTSDGCTSHKQRTYKTGGTGTAISIADCYKIPIYNLANEETRKRIERNMM